MAALMRQDAARLAVTADAAGLPFMTARIEHGDIDAFLAYAGRSVNYTSTPYRRLMEGMKRNAEGLVDWCDFSAAMYAHDRATAVMQDGSLSRPEFILALTMVATQGLGWGAANHAAVLLRRILEGKPMASVADDGAVPAHFIHAPPGPQFRYLMSRLEAFYATLFGESMAPGVAAKPVQVHEDPDFFRVERYLDKVLLRVFQVYASLGVPVDPTLAASGQLASVALGSGDATATLFASDVATAAAAPHVVGMSLDQFAMFVRELRLTPSLLPADIHAVFMVAAGMQPAALARMAAAAAAGGEAAAAAASATAPPVAVGTGSSSSRAPAAAPAPDIVPSLCVQLRCTPVALGRKRAPAAVWRTLDFWQFRVAVRLLLRAGFSRGQKSVGAVNDATYVEPLAADTGLSPEGVALRLAAWRLNMQFLVYQPAARMGPPWLRRHYHVKVAPLWAGGDGDDDGDSGADDDGGRDTAVGLDDTSDEDAAAAAAAAANPPVRTAAARRASVAMRELHAQLEHFQVAGAGAAGGDAASGSDSDGSTGSSGGSRRGGGGGGGGRSKPEGATSRTTPRRPGPSSLRLHTTASAAKIISPLGGGGGGGGGDVGGGAPPRRRRFKKKHVNVASLVEETAAPVPARPAMLPGLRAAKLKSADMALASMPAARARAVTRMYHLANALARTAEVMTGEPLLVASDLGAGSPLPSRIVPRRASAVGAAAPVVGAAAAPAPTVAPTSTSSMIPDPEVAGAAASAALAAGMRVPQPPPASARRTTAGSGPRVAGSRGSRGAPAAAPTEQPGGMRVWSRSLARALEEGEDDWLAAPTAAPAPPSRAGAQPGRHATPTRPAGTPSAGRGMMGGARGKPALSSKEANDLVGGVASRAAALIASNRGEATNTALASLLAHARGGTATGTAAAAAAVAPTPASVPASVPSVPALTPASAAAAVGTADDDSDSTDDVDYGLAALSVDAEEEGLAAV